MFRLTVVSEPLPLFQDRHLAADCFNNFFLAFALVVSNYAVAKLFMKVSSNSPSFISAVTGWLTDGQKELIF